MASKEVVELEVAGHTVRITSPHKVFFPERGETKADLVAYYQAVAEPLMRTMVGRPTLLQRFPDGAAGKSFFQKRVPAGAPDWLSTMVVSTPNGTTSNALVAEDLAHILWAVNMGCLGFHSWPVRAAIRPSRHSSRMPSAEESFNTPSAPPVAKDSASSAPGSMSMESSTRRSP